MGKRGAQPGKGFKSPTSGRKKGTPNKITTNLILELEALGYHPVVELVEIIRDARAEYKRAKIIHDKIEANQDDKDVRGYKSDNGPQYLSIAARAAGDLMKFVFPTRKAVEHSIDEIGVQSFSELVKVVLSNPDGDK